MGYQCPDLLKVQLFYQYSLWLIRILLLASQFHIVIFKHHLFCYWLHYFLASQYMNTIQSNLMLFIENEYQ